jgi:hypothetical protein
VRSIVTVIAALCVATAGQGRLDELDTHRHNVATLAPAPATIATPAQRRADERRDLPFVAPASPEIAAPARTAVVATPASIDSIAASEPPVPCSRGPPRG